MQSDASDVKSHVKHVRRSRSGDKSKSRQNKDVEEEDEADIVDSWRFNTAQKGECFCQIVFDLRFGTLVAITYRELNPV